MKRLVISFCFVLIFALVATSVPAQAKQKVTKAKPDFSGTWQLDTAKSNVATIDNIRPAFEDYSSRSGIPNHTPWLKVMVR